MDLRQETLEKLESKVKTLIEKVWKGSDLNIKRVQNWYLQFQDDDTLEKNEQIQFLFLLSKFMFFGKHEIMEMLRSVYRDLYRCRIIHKIRKANSDSLDEVFLNQEFKKILSKTRFLGLGNPSESGSYLLYKFRQVNELGRDLFIHTHEIFSFKSEIDIHGNERNVTEISDPDIEYYVLIDDLACSGSQADDYSRDIVATIKKLNPDAKIYYFVLIATTQALKRLEGKGFDLVDCVFELDDSYKCFANDSRYYANEEEIYDKIFTKTQCGDRDLRLEEAKYKLGYKEGQLLLSFDHNTPDNVPPIFWSEGNSATNWVPVFKRYHKKYQTI